MKPNNPIDATPDECTWIKSALPNKDKLLNKTKAGLIYTDDKTLKDDRIKLVNDPKKEICKELYKEGFEIERGIHKTAFIYELETEYDDSLIVGAGSVIGCEGFNYTKYGWKLPHIGKVIIGKNVEIGANNTI